MPSADGLFSPKGGLIETRLPGELILLDPETQEMFALNETGQVIWDALRTQSIPAAAVLIAERFEVTPEAAERDVRALADQLVAAGLLRARDADER
jgi:hypothetical protein